jgi:hypothetical protein
VLLIAYYRVSGAKQARAAHGPAPLFDPACRDAPGLEAQRSKVQRLRQSLLSGGEKVARVVEDVLEVESQEHRPQLALAMKFVRRHLPQPVAVVVAQLYSLARDADFLQQLAKEAELGRQMGSGFKGFLFPDLPDPQTPAQLLADLARFELEACEGDGKRGRANPGTDRRNARTRAAAIDRAEQLRPLLAPLHANGASLRVMAGALAAAGTTTTKGNPLSPTQIKRHLGSLGLLAG